MALNSQDDSNPQSGALLRNRDSQSSFTIRKAKALGLSLGIPCIDAVEEAESQCAFLNSDSFCDGCFSSDPDTFLFGANTVYRDILLGGEGGHVVCYEMKDIWRKLGFGRNSLIALAVLLGSDYSQGVRGFGPETACRFDKAIGDDKVLLKINSERNNCLCNAGGKSIIGSEDEYMKVIDSYLNPKCNSPDSVIVQRACAQHSFVRTELHQICEQYFYLIPEKTDEYILPKIAEGDLRRFANLHLASLTLGGRLPLDKMPVPCPITTIVKERKMQGRACFEASWQGIEGLKTSISFTKGKEECVQLVSQGA